LCFNRIGNAQLTNGNYAKAMEAFLQSLKLYESVNDLSGMGRNTNNIGYIYRNMGEYSQALAYGKRSKQIFEKIDNKKGDGIALCLNNIGRDYFGLNQYDSARVCAQQAYEAYKKLRSIRQGDPLLLLGSVYLRTGETKLALEYYRLSLPYLIQRENHPLTCEALLGMAKAFEAENMPDSAIICANRAFKTGSSLGKYNQQVADAANFLVTFYDKKRIADSTIFYFKAAKAAKDTLYSQQRLSQLQSLAFDEQLRQIELANSEEERKHNLQFAGLAVAILTFLILFFALSRTIIVKENFIVYFNVIVLLAVFEFINLLIHPYLARFTHESPPLMLLILIGIGALLVPLHHKLEHWIAHVLTEKNKQIRLAAAKKTIAHLEGEANH
jgi:tetratricopeptide (TPR) repeat protein